MEIRLAARPLVLFTGILGAGKTTFLRTLLPVLNRLGIPARVVINDYHNAAVDAATLAHLTDEVTAVSGSCVCCDSRDELFDALAKAGAPDKAKPMQAQAAAVKASQRLRGKVAKAKNSKALKAN